MTEGRPSVNLVDSGGIFAEPVFCGLYGKARLRKRRVVASEPRKRRSRTAYLRSHWELDNPREFIFRVPGVWSNGTFVWVKPGCVSDTGINLHNGDVRQDLRPGEFAIATRPHADSSWDIYRWAPQGKTAMRWIMQ